MKQQIKHRRPKKGKISGTLVGAFEVTYCQTRKSWQIWHPEYGFLGAYKFKDKAIEKARQLFNEELKKTGS